MVTYLTQIHELSTDTSALHPDVAEFHFDDYQRVIHISGCTLRSEFRVQQCQLWDTHKVAIYIIICLTESADEA